MEFPETWIWILGIARTRGETLGIRGTITGGIKRILTGALMISMFCVLRAGAAGNPPKQPENLKINLLEKPMGVEKEDLRFSWVFSDPDENEKQTGFRIVIGKTERQTEQQEYLYDSGWQESSISSGVKISDLSGLLEDNSLYYWSVQTRDKDGLESPLSKPQPFTTAVGNSWKSTTGIWGSADQAFVFLRGTFQSKGAIEKAVVSVTASSPEKARQYIYDFYVNGSLVGIGPSRINAGKLYYNTYDITEYLKNGTNVLGAICYAEKERTFLCQLTVFYQDGTREILMNSGSDRANWKALDANQVFGNQGINIGVGAYYYASAQNMNGVLYPYGWSKAGYQPTAWNTVSAAADLRSSGKLTPYPSEAVLRYEQKAEKVTKLSADSYVIDLGKEIVGSLELRIDPPGQTQITVSYGEELNQDGSVKYKLRTGNVYREAWTLKKGYQRLRDTGMKTYRYVQIDQCPVNLTADMVSGMAVRQEFSDEKSGFNSSNSILNDLYGMTKYTIKASNQDLYVDSQSRERAAYEGDILINMLSSYSFEDDYSLARHSLDYTANNPTWPAEYPLFCIMGAWQDYLYTGDRAFLEEHYDLLAGKLYESCYDSSLGLVKKPDKTLLIDWPTSERDGYDTSVQYNTVFNAICVGAYKNMADISELLGKSEKAAEYRQKADTIRKNLIERLYNQETGTFYDGLSSGGQIVNHSAQHATAYALAYDIYSDQDMADRMADSIEAEGQVQMSVYGTFFLLQGLYESNNGLLARKILSNPNVNEGVKSWAYMMYELDATMTTEAWNPETKGNMTYSHPWGSAPASQLARGMFGIQPLSGGFESFRIKLQPGGVASAEIQVPTVKGTIGVSYEMLGDGRLRVRTEIPGNTEALVYIPTNIPENTLIELNGQEQKAEYENGYLVFTLGSGTYEILSDSEIYEDTSELWTNASLSYSGYDAGKGWTDAVQSNIVLGTEGKALEDLKVQLHADEMDGNIRMSLHLAHVGWQNWMDAENGAGTAGKGNEIQAVRLELTGQAAQQYDLYYRVYARNHGWLGWAKNGEEAGTVGLAKAVQMIQIKLAVKGKTPAESGGTPCIWAGTTVSYSTHMQSYGWMPEVSDGVVGGVVGQSKRMEAIKVKVNSPHLEGGITYRTYLQTYGWQNWSENGAASGKVGQAKRMEAIQIRLTGELEKNYDVYYRVHVQSYGWLGWAKNGASAGTADYAKRIEAIQIVLIGKGGTAPGSTENSFRCPTGVFYQTHVQSYGWQGEKSNGQTSGTSGQSKRLEAIMISLKNMGMSGNIEYRTHVQTYGWLDWVKNGQLSGTSGQSKRLEAIEIRLTGQMAEKYDIYYRVHAQTYGWLGWARNGETAGTRGQSKRLEAIEIKLVRKGTVIERGGVSCYGLEPEASENLPEAVESETSLPEESLIEETKQNPVQETQADPTEEETEALPEESSETEAENPAESKQEEIETERQERFSAESLSGETP